MKRLLLLAFFGFATLGSTAQEISEDQWTLVTKKTATWCSLCGSWGWDFKDNLLEDQQDMPVVFWMAHFSGDLQTETAKAIINNFGGSGQPIFYIGTDNMGVGSGNANQKRDEFKITIESLNAFPPFAGVGSTAEFDGEKITTKSRVKFLIDLEGGEYWLASYLVDDELVAFQQSQGNNATHENVLLHSFHGTNYFGENVTTGSVEANQEFTVDGEFLISDDPSLENVGEGYSVVTVLWSRVDGKYTPFNLNRQPITTVVSTKDILNSVDVSAFYAGAGQVNLSVTSDQNISDATVYLYDINGRTVAMKNNVQIYAGENQLTLQSQELSPATYVAVIESSQGSKSIKISIR
ncbi:MAG: T9SS type A sorting domain-containing protein [Saprospiraceae bacterium]|nr:T9SS type A sorting domain-containing protein [Saprospiraceae bacterium]